MTRPIALFLTVLTGFSGLVYEVAWQKYLAILLGSHSEATAAVLGIFLGGLATGYALFGRVTRRTVLRAHGRGETPRLLGLYGRVEATIGLYALAFPLLFSGAQALSIRIPHVGDSVAFSLDVLLTTLLIAPPTILMGGTIPVLTQALSQRLDEATRVHARIYAFNTGGAFFGALASAFVLIPALGLDGAVRAMGAVNCAAGGVFLLLQRRPQPALPGPEVASAGGAPERFAGYAAVVLLAGFAMMCVQTVLNRIGGLSLGASHFTFAMVVAVFVLCIALGSLAVSALRRIPTVGIVASQWLLVALLALLYFQLPNVPYYAHVVRSLFRPVAESFFAYHLLLFLGMLAFLAVPIGLAGALLPLVFHHLRNEMGDLGGVAGRLYAWNTLGSLLGALLGGYALLFFVDLHHVFAIAVGALAIGAGILTALLLRPPLMAPGLVTVAVLATCFFLPDWDPNRMSSGLFRRRTPLEKTFEGADAFFTERVTQLDIVYSDDDPTATIAVADLGRTLLNNGKSDGHVVRDYPTMALIGLVPALLSDDVSRAFVVGWGLGVTAGELGALKQVEEVVAAEISPAVLDVAPYFDGGALYASKNAKIRKIRSDAYRALLRSEGRFGVIASEPSNPWVMGVEMLYSEEFLSAARDRLTPGGVFAQWFHLYEMNGATVETVLRTYDHVFGDMTVWLTHGTDVLLLGFKDPSRTLDLDALRARFERADFRAGFERAGVDSWIELLSHEAVPAGAIRASKLAGPLHSVRHPILSDEAVRAFFAGGRALLPRMPSEAAVRSANGRSLLKRAMGEDGPSEDVLEAIARHTCPIKLSVACADSLAYWIASHPDSARLRQTLEELRSDEAGKNPESVLQIQPSVIDPLVELYRGEPATAPSSPEPLTNAIFTSNVYARYFHHAFPFPRAALEQAWSRCEAARSCARERRIAEAMLGPIALGRR